MDELAQKGLVLIELDTDRGYIPAEAITKAREQGVTVVSKPPTPPKSPYYSKDDFVFNFENDTVTCPASVVRPLNSPKTTFPVSECSRCELRAKCTSSSRRAVSVHPQEKWYRQMAHDLNTPAGRARRRGRIPVEHALARVSAIQGNRARFRGLHKNDFELQRVAVVNNCHVLASLWTNVA